MDLIIYYTEDGQAKVSLYARDGTVWMTQAQLCELFEIGKSSVSEHISHILKEGELDERAVVRKIRTTADDGKSYLTSL